MTWMTVRAGERQSLVLQEPSRYLGSSAGDAVGIDLGEIEWM